MTNDAQNKLYETDVRSDDEYADLPSKVRFEISKDDAQEIVRLSALVAEHSLYKVERFDGRATWLNGEGDDESEDPDEVSTELGCLNVSAREFWFSASLKHTDVEVLTERQGVDALKEWLGVRESARPEVAATEAVPVAQPRVLVVVSGGIAETVYDDGVEVEVFDWDNYNDDPEGTGGVSEHFADLAEPLGIPVEHEARAAERPQQ